MSHSHSLVALLIFVSTFASALAGLYLRNRLPNEHFSQPSIDAIKLATGLLATMAALVLGLLVSSAKNSLDSVNSELTRSAAKIMQLDRILGEYGPAAESVRAAMRRDYAQTVALLAAGEPARVDQLDTQTRLDRLEKYQVTLMRLPADDDVQRQMRARAVQLENDISGTRWLLVVQREGSISVPLLIVLVLWLIVIFGAFGMLSPGNRVVVTALLLCALSASGAIFLILEMDRPLDGIIRISTLPLRDAMQRLTE